MDNILITGGCGFVGSNLAVFLARHGYAVTVLDNLTRRGSELLKDRAVAHGVRFVHGDVRQAEHLEGLDGKFALMIECSAEPSVLAGTQGKDARYVLDVNLQGAINCFEWARQHRVAVIFLSSSRVYPYDRLNALRFQESQTRFELVESQLGVTPQGVSVDMPIAGVRSLYGATKLCAELILKEYAIQYGLPSIVNRCGVIAGPWQLGKVDQGVFTFWLANHYFKQPLQYIGFGGQGKQVRDLLHVDDLAELILKQVKCLIKDQPAYRADVFNVGGSTHSSLSLQETTAICRKLTGNTVAIKSVLENRPADLIWFVTDNGDTQKIFDWSPQRTAHDIIKDTFLWLKDNESLFRQVFVKD